jgi:hypothetical protein
VSEQVTEIPDTVESLDRLMPPEPAQSRPPLPDPLFDEFWAAYPRKVSKMDARKAWSRAIRHTDARLIIAAAESFRDKCLARGTQKEFIAYPFKWLAGERWNDETASDATTVIPASPPGVLNHEQLLAEVIRLTADHQQPVTAAAQIIALVRQDMPAADLEGWPVVSAERGQALAQMPYDEYLQTPEWDARRKAVLKRAGRRCQVCNEQRMLHAHHRTYERRGMEDPADLTVLCDRCHSLYHGKDLLADEPGVA